MPQWIDGRALAQEIQAEVENEIGRLKEAGVVPGLAVVLVGDHPASHVYVRSKVKTCQSLGMLSEKVELPADSTTEQVLESVDSLNRRSDLHGVLVQVPLPPQVDARRVLNSILPEKDVDGFHPVNVGRLVIGTEGFKPCTPYGVIHLLKRSGVKLAGAEAVVVGRSNIVGKPVALMLIQESATVTVCHSKTKDLGEVCRRADVLVVAIGRPKFVTADMVKPGAVVIDVGVNRLPDGKLCGDVDYEPLAQKVAQITPVPGGVGPMTIAMLMFNTVNSARRRAGLPALK